MTYRVNEKILYKGRTCRVLEYSKRFELYTVVYEGPGDLAGYTVYDAAADDMEPFPVYVTAACTKCYLTHSNVLKQHENNFICPTCEGGKA